MANALTLVDQKANSLQQLFESHKGDIAKALPAHLTPDRMMRIALTEARKTPQLLECDQASFLGAVIQASQLGLEPGNSLGYCYLIPFKNYKSQRSEVQFMMGYQGMIELVRRSSEVSRLIARSVFEGDEFEVLYGDQERIHHKPKLGAKKGMLTHVYAIAFLKDGTKSFDVMTIDEVEEIKRRSKSGNNGPWVSDFEAMAKKTVIRRLFKYLPKSIEMQRAINLDELADVGEGQGHETVIGIDPAPMASSANEIKERFQGREEPREVEAEVEPSKTVVKPKSLSPMDPVGMVNKLRDQQQSEPTFEDFGVDPQSDLKLSDDFTEASNRIIHFGTNTKGKRIGDLTDGVLDKLLGYLRAKEGKSDEDLSLEQDINYYLGKK